MSDNLPVITENMGKAGQIGYSPHQSEHFSNLGRFKSIKVIHNDDEFQIQSNQLFRNFSPQFCCRFLINCETTLGKYFYPACYPVNDAGKLPDILNQRKNAR